MKHRKLLIGVVIALAVILAAVIGAGAWLMLRTDAPAATEPTAAVMPTATEATTVPAETTEPQPEHFMLSFVGDCTFGQQDGENWANSFAKVVKDNYSYPFRNAQAYFGTDEYTFINMECTMSNLGTKQEKYYNYRADPKYVKVLTEGSVEFAAMVNNHTKDYGTTGYDDMAKLLTETGISYTDDNEAKLFTTSNGIKIGVYSRYFPNNSKGMQEKIQGLRDQGAHVVICAFHWGEMYYYVPNATQKKIAHDCIDYGADLIWGHHSHLLQPMEIYNGKAICYSLGNFCYGGSPNPKDPDTALVQLEIIRDVDGTVTVGEAKAIPFSMTSGTMKNDFCPTPLEVGTEAYERVLTKLAGKFGVTNLPYTTPKKKTEETTAATEAPTATEPKATETPQ